MLRKHTGSKDGSLAQPTSRLDPTPLMRRRAAIDEWHRQQGELFLYWIEKKRA